MAQQEIRSCAGLLTIHLIGSRALAKLTKVLRCAVVVQPNVRSGPLRNPKEGNQATGGESGCLRGLPDIIRLGIQDRLVTGVSNLKEAAAIRTRMTPDMSIKQMSPIIADKEAAVNSKLLRRKRNLQREIKSKSHVNQL